MASVNPLPEKASNSLAVRESAPDAPMQVFQPPKLKEVMELVDLMGSISERMGEDKSSDMGGGGQGAATGTGQQAAQTTRDELIAAIPDESEMKQKLVSHINQKIHSLNRQARKLSYSRATGSAYALTEVYKRIRYLSSLIEEILAAGIDIVKRFYIAVFIDKQTL